MSDKYGDLGNEELWQSVRAASDSLAFAELHRRFSAKLYALAYRKTGNREASEDLVQDLFVSLWMQRDTLSIEKAVPVYLFSALKNRIISYLRKQMIRQSFSLNDLDSDQLVSHSTNAVQDWIQLTETQEVYARELENLPAFFELSRSGLANKEIAELLGLAEKTIEFHIGKCLRVLRVKLLSIASILAMIVGLYR